MEPLSFAGRAGLAWAIALGAGLATSRFPALGPVLGVSGLAYCLWCRRLPASARIAALSAAGLGALLPWAALARDPFHALPAQAAWPVAAIVWAMVGSGTATLSWLSVAEAPPSQPTPAEPALRRALLVELGVLALTLPLSIAATQIALGFATATLLIAYARGARGRMATALDLPIAAVLVAAAVATALSPAPTSPISTTALRTLLAFYVVSRALAITGPSDGELGRLAGLWAGASALVSLLAFSQHWSGFDAVAALGLRSPVQVLAPESPGHLAGIGAFSSRLTFAHATLTILATLLGLQLCGALDARRRRWLRAAVVLQTGGLWSTFARAAWLSLAAVGAAALVVAAWLGSRVRVLIGVAAIGAALVLLLTLSPGTRARAYAIRPSDNHDRLFLWARAAQVAIDHPVFGVGFGSYHLVLDPYYDRFDPKFPMRTWAHDMPLSMLCETGPLGLFAFLWLLAAGLGLGVGALRRPQGHAMWRGLALGGALATLAFAVVSGFHDVLYDGQVGYNLFFSLGLAAWASTQLDCTARGPTI